MRHLGAGLAIPDFPLAFGGLLPPAWPLPIAIHFSHRAGAVVVLILVALAAGYIRTRHRDRSELTRPAWMLAALVLTQATLGAFVVLTFKQPVVNTFHVAVGALVFGTSVLLALRAYRVRFGDTVAPELKLRGSGYVATVDRWSPGPLGPGTRP
jgi:cytochrome c oxidase assembly protein subunit 15